MTVDEGTPGTWDTFKAQAWAGMKALVAAPGKFTTKLISDEDHAVEAQIIGFCFLTAFSLYWLHTRQNITTQWATCFATMWGALALNNVFKRRGGSS